MSLRLSEMGICSQLKVLETRVSFLINSHLKVPDREARNWGGALYNAPPDYWNFADLLGWIDRKHIFWKSWKIFRTSRSKQNFTADRMGALSASQTHPKA